MQVRKLSAFERAAHNSTTTTSTPAIGVKEPARRRTPAPIASDCRMIPCHWGALSSSTSPSCVRTIPTTSRRSRRPLPGQPLGNMENSRCTGASTTRLGEAQRSRIPKNRGSNTPLSRGYSSMIPRFSPIVTAWVLSFAPSLERMFLT
jgi:hypothetical protein